jgi:hypothetical protein
MDNERLKALLKGVCGEGYEVRRGSNLYLGHAWRSRRLIRVKMNLRKFDDICSLDHVRRFWRDFNLELHRARTLRIIPRRSQPRMATKRGSSHTAGASFSASRISRLLRPLRNKCTILASATSRSSGSAAAITYGSSSLPLLEARFPPPLDVLHDPKHIISHARQESRSLDALARQIYAITSAYRNIVQAAFPEGLDGGQRGILVLTDICAAIVGRSIKPEVARCVATLEGEPDEMQETALVDELYESVPIRFRRFVSCLLSLAYRHSSHSHTGGLLLRTRHLKSLTHVLITPCSCSAFLG